ncbi:MAG: hypothetical protein E6590_17405 [Clostridiales bacterium]|nr:hypothetical protein [Clostridiales bacterium]
MDMAKDKNEERKPLLNQLLFIEEYGVAYREGEFLISFYGNEKDFEKDTLTKVERNIVIESEDFLDMIKTLIKSGILYQDEMGENIGFPQKGKKVGEDDE